VAAIATDMKLEPLLVQDILAGRESAQVVEYKYLLGPDRFTVLRKKIEDEYARLLRAEVPEPSQRAPD
jgi:hypothetical protein